MISFVMKDGRLQMTEQFMMIPAFVDIWERDKKKEKKHANSLLFYVYLMCDLSEDEFKEIMLTGGKDEQGTPRRGPNVLEQNND